MGQGWVTSLVPAFLSAVCRGSWPGNAMGMNLTVLQMLGNGRGEEKWGNWPETVLCPCASSLSSLKGSQMFTWAKQATEPRGPLLLSSTPWSLQLLWLLFQSTMWRCLAFQAGRRRNSHHGRSHLQNLDPHVQGLIATGVGAVTGCWLSRGQWQPHLLRQTSCTLSGNNNAAISLLENQYRSSCDSCLALVWVA